MSFRTVAAAALAVSVLAISLPAADAGHRHRHHHHHHHNGAAAAIIGLGFGVIIGSILAQPRYGHGYEEYEEPVRYPYRPRPWTDEWYQYCDDKYKTFDPRSRKYRGYDGNLHFCR